VYREHAVRDRLGFAQGVAARRCDGKPSRTHALRVVAAVAGARFRAQFPGTDGQRGRSAQTLIHAPNHGGKVNFPN